MPEEIHDHLIRHKYHDPVRRAYYLPDPENLKKVYIKVFHGTCENIRKTTNNPGRIPRTQNRKQPPNDMVLDMKKELKELKGEA